MASGKNAGQPSRVSSAPAKKVSSSKQACFFSVPGQFVCPQVSSFLAEAPRQSQGQWTDLLLPQRVLHLQQKREVLQEEPTWFLRGKQPVRAGPGSSAGLQYQVTFLCLGNGVRELLEFGNEEPIHVVCVGIETPCMLEGGVETPVLEPGGGKGMRNDRKPLVNPGQQGRVSHLCSL